MFKSPSLYSQDVSFRLGLTHQSNHVSLFHSNIAFPPRIKRTLQNKCQLYIECKFLTSISPWTLKYLSLALDFDEYSISFPDQERDYWGWILLVVNLQLVYLMKSFLKKKNTLIGFWKLRLQGHVQKRMVNNCLSLFYVILYF